MGTEKIKAALDRFGMESRNSQTDVMVADALNELGALRAAVRDLITWNNEGQPGLSVNAARGWSLLEKIAKEPLP